MTELKGEVLPIRDILPGTPVLFADARDVADSYNGRQVEHPPEMSLAIGDALAYPRFMDQKGTCLSTQSREIKCLTGTRGTQFKATFKSAMEKAAFRPLFNSAISAGMSSGSDPEIFVVDKAGNLLPAYLFLPKKNPRNGIEQCYWDGFQAEFSHSPYGCLESMGICIRRGIMNVQSAAEAYSKGAKLTLRNVMPVPHNLLANADAEHVALGCAPSRNAYNVHGMQVSDSRQLEVRFAGGHMHFSPTLSKNEEIREWQIAEAVKTADVLIGIPSVSLAACVDDPVRRQWYGLAGEYRTPKHGLEYRTLSNFWLAAPAIYNLVFDIARWAVRIGIQGLRYCIDADEQQVQDIINTCDVKGARKFIEQHKDLYQSALACTYGSGAPVSQGLQAFLNGMEYVVNDPFDIAHNWDFSGDIWREYNIRTRGYQWHSASVILANGQKV